MPALASSVVSVGPTICQRRSILNTAVASMYTPALLKNESCDRISKVDHASETSCERALSGSYCLLAHEARAPIRRASFPTSLVASHLTNSFPVDCFVPSVMSPTRQWVRDFGVASDQGIRSTMEDEHMAMVDGDVAFFGVYDGHGGRQCAEYVRDHLHHAVLNHADARLAPCRAMSDAFARIEHDFLELSDPAQSSAGCVCAAALLQGDLLTVANVGDCEVVLGRAGQPVVLTVKHNPSCSDAEVARVTEAGGCIFNRRVGHPWLNPRVCSLAVSRAVGDAGFKLDAYTRGKPSGIIADADTREVHLTAEDTFLIIACDGLWDTMTYAEAVKLCMQYLEGDMDANTVADKLVCEALMRGARDNITVVFVLLGADNLKPAK